MKDNLPLIYGIMDEPSPFGVRAYAIDGQTGEIITQHFCSNESFAKSDLGFTDPLRMTVPFGTQPHSTISFNEQRKSKYAERYPAGFKLEWIGFWASNNHIRSLVAKQIKPTASE